MLLRKGTALILIGLLSMFMLVPVFAAGSESQGVMHSELTQEGIPKSIKIVPQALNLKEGKAAEIRVIAKYDKKGSENVSDAVLTVSDDTVLYVSGMTVTALKKGEAKLTATYRGVSDEIHVNVKGSKDVRHSTYRFQYDLPETIGAGQYLQVPVTLETEESGEKGYEDVHISFEKVEGPGDILFRAKDDSGSIQTFLNQGKWRKSAFDLPAQYRQTEDWTLKFSQKGTYTFVYRIVDSNGSVVAETPQVVEVTPHLEDLGVQIANLTIMTGAFGQDQAGKDVGYTVIVGEPGKFAIVDTESEKVLRTLDLPGATGAWTVVAMEDGTVYIGTYPNGHLYKYTPGLDKVEDLGQPIAGTTVVYSLIPGKDGKIYGGTYPGGNLFQYDPASGATDLGKMKPGEQYVRAVAYDREKELLYTGVGAHAALIEYNLATGAKRNILPEAYAKYSFVYDLNLIGGKLFVRLDPESKMVVLDAATGKVDAEFTAHSRSVIADPVRKNIIYYTYGVHLYEYNLDTKKSSQVMIGGHPAELGQTAIGWEFLNLNDTDYPGPTLFGFIGNYDGKAFKYNLQTQKLKIFTLPLPAQPTDIFNVAAGPDGNIYSNGYISGGVGIFSPDTRSLIKRTGIGQAESMISLGNKMYFGVYPDAKIFEYDLSIPWKSKQNPRQLFTMGAENQNRPVTMAGSEEHQKLFVGTTPHYGKLGGAFAIYDLTSGQADIRRNLIPDQSVISLVHKDGKIYGGSSIYGESTDPVAKEAKLFVWDIAEGRMTFETVPVPGNTAIGALLVGPEGHIWGLAQGTLFIFDPEQQKVIYQEEKFPGLHYNRGGVALQLGKDGNIYGTAQGKLFRVDPESKEVTILRDRDSHRLAQDKYGNLYFKNGPAASYGNTLWRYTVEDRTVSVTGVNLDRRELNLKAGEEAVLTAEIAPEMATNKTLTWESDNIAVATVSSSGQVKAMAPGTAVIKVTTQDGGLIAVSKVHVE